MSVAPIEKSKTSTGSLNTSSTSLVISKDTGVTLVHPDGKKLPEEFEYVKPEKSAGIINYSVFTRVPNPGWVPGFLEKSGLGFLNLKTRVPGFLYFLEFFL